MTKQPFSRESARAVISSASWLFAVIIAVGAVAIADVLAPTGVLVAVFALAMLGVTAFYLRSGDARK